MFFNTPIIQNVGSILKNFVFSVSPKCQDQYGNTLGGGHCDPIYEIECPFNRCSEAYTIYKCQNGEEYFTVPCSKLPDGDDFDICIAHMSNVNQFCSTCCRNQNCGQGMPICPTN